MPRAIRQFFDDDSGAVTIDWVVLTAAIVALGIAVVTTVGPSLTQLGQNIADTEVSIEQILGGDEAR